VEMRYQKFMLKLIYSFTVTNTDVYSLSPLSFILKFLFTRFPSHTMDNETVGYVVVMN
jgi:hypothetical protein